jgi:hypothetical protein
MSALARSRFDEYLKRIGVRWGRMTHAHSVSRFVCVSFDFFVKIIIPANRRAVGVLVIDLRARLHSSRRREGCVCAFCSAVLAKPHHRQPWQKIHSLHGKQRALREKAAALHTGGGCKLEIKLFSTLKYTATQNERSSGTRKT